MDVTVYIIGLLVAASLTMAWFLSTAPIHVFYLMRKLLGWKGDEEEFWERIPEWETTWQEWADHIALAMSPCVSTLLTCRYCLSFHIAFWVSLGCWFLTPVSFLFIPAATLSWPILISILVRKANDK